MNCSLGERGRVHDPKLICEGNLDRSAQHTDPSPQKLLYQLNENWKQLRLFSAAVADRDQIINGLHLSIATRDRAIHLLNGRLRYAKVKIALLYALVGAVAAKGAEVLVLGLIHWAK